MNGVKAFLDTNLFVYLYSDTDEGKREKVIQTINKYERFISTQVLNEFCSVCIRKLKIPIRSVREAIAEITSVCSEIIIDDETIISALGYHEKYGYSFYDCLMLASALEGGCEFLLSEDMSDGHVIEGCLAIKNIFL